MEPHLNDFEDEERIRPALLKVLCILTFIGSSFLILMQIGSYSTASKTAQMMSSLKDKEQKDSVISKDSSLQHKHAANRKRFFFGKTIMSSVSKSMTPENIRKTAIGNMLSAIFTLIGAILMWHLKRSGFFIYVFGIVISVAVPFLLYGFNTMSFGFAFFSGFFGLLFTVLYALNIKSLQ
ncbi:MAG TPA: hypothetical protein VIJ92_07455 [Ginsengibacter sp.]